MGHIKEPKGVDFFIQSEPLTDEARKEISTFILNYKKKKIMTKSLVKNKKSLLLK